MYDNFVSGLRDAVPYINTHRGRCFVIQVSGEIIASQQIKSLIHDLGLLDSLGIKLVLVHGARPQIEQRLATAGLQIQYQHGMIITTADMIPVIKEAVGASRIEIEALLSSTIVNSRVFRKRPRVVCGNFISACPVGIIEGVNYHYTGRVRRVDTEAIEDRLNSTSIVLVSPLGYSPEGEIFNLHTEDLATTLAIELKAAKLIFINNATSTYQSVIPAEEGREFKLNKAQTLLHQLRRNTTIDALDIAPLQYAVHACRNGVERTHLLNYKVDGTILLELFTRDGVGIMINADDYDVIRSAIVEDTNTILNLIEPLEKSGKLIPRSQKNIALEIADYLVIERDGAIIGCAAAHVFEAEKITELACLAVHKEYRCHRRGQQLLRAIESRARQKGSQKLLVLTTQTEHWFIEHGFKIAAMSDLPAAKTPVYDRKRRAKILIKSL